MARRVFFSFHYEDIWRASQVRNSWVCQRDRESAGFWDAAEWSKVQSGGDEAVKRWIRDQMSGTSVTVVLIGSQTSERYYVGYEIQHSYTKGNGMLGIYIHGVRDMSGYASSRGGNPFDNWEVKDGNSNSRLLSELYPTYDWNADNGRSNIGSWIEDAATKAGH